MRRPLRHRELALALAFSLWAAVFLAPHPGPALVLVPLGFAVSGALVQRNTVLGSLVGAATQALGLVVGAPAENASGLLSGLCCLYLAGRRLRAEWGLGILAVYVLVVAMTGLGTLRSVVGAGLFTGTWLLGQVVATSAARVAARRAAAEDLERRDHAALAAGVVERERTRILTGSLDIVQEAVESMQADAAAAVDRLDRTRLDRVGTRGEQAISDLRRVLGLLRSTEARESPLDAPLRSFVESDPEPARHEGGQWRIDALTAVVLAAAGLVEAVGSDKTPAGIVLASLVPLGLALRRTALLAAAVCCAAPLAVSVVVGVSLPRGPSEMLTLALLAWSTAAVLAAGGGRTERLPLLGALALAAGLSALGTSDTWSLVPLAAAAVALVAGGSRAAVARAQREADARLALAQEELASQLEDAVTAERFRLARELHDITSHAVGAMVLQARAASALSTRDPEAARRSVENALLAGDQALAELDRLWSVLGEERRPSGEDLVTLVERLSGADLVIYLDGELPNRPDLAVTVHRVVQEALTNAARHAPGARVRVRVDQQPDLVLVEVVDDGGRADAVRTGGTGFGLAGLTERLRLLGGDLSAGPYGDGFRVLARLPVASPVDDPSKPGPATPDAHRTQADVRMTP